MTPTPDFGLAAVFDAMTQWGFVAHWLPARVLTHPGRRSGGAPTPEHGKPFTAQYQFVTPGRSRAPPMTRVGPTTLQRRNNTAPAELARLMQILGGMTTTTMTTTTFHRPRFAAVAWMAALSGALAQLVLLAQ